MENKETTAKLYLLPMFIGLLLIKAYKLAYDKYYFDFQDSWIFIIVIAVIIRLLIGFWTISITNKYKLKQTLWVFLGFTFGSLQLIAINIAILMRRNKT